MRLAAKFISLVAVGLLATISSYASSSDTKVEPGLPAPSMAVKKWLKGTPVNTLSPDKIYVVEFWATWCGPCLQSIPHLTQVAKANQDVTFVGISIWEDDHGNNIQDFVNKEGVKMDYHVGYSGNQDGMAQSWMQAAGQNGIPTAFIVKHGTIEWVGHPMEIEKPLAEIKSGKFDLTGFKIQFDARAEKNRKMMAEQAELRAIQKQYDDGEHAKAKDRLGALLSKDADMTDTVESIRFGWFAKEDPSAWSAKATALANSGDEKSQRVLIQFALGQAGRPSTDNLAQAHQAIDLVLSATKRSKMEVLYYSHIFYRQTKEFALDAPVVDKLLELLPQSPEKDNEQLKAELQKAKDFDQQQLQPKTKSI